MDYIALNHNSERAKGVIYNSRKAIGGIYYQDEKTRPVKVQQDPVSGRQEAFVEIEKKFARREKEVMQKNTAEIKKIVERYSDRFEGNVAKKEEIMSEKINELQEERARFEKRLARQKERAMRRVKLKLARQQERQIKELAEENEELKKKLAQQAEKEAQEKAKLAKIKKRRYTITVKGQKVDFGKEGIKKAKLSWQEKDWLAKAQNHFITATERGRRVGSAEEYTSMEALHALWSTAEHVGIDPKRFIVQIYNETRFNPNARGAAGERGIGQFKKTTAQLYGYDWYKMKSGMPGYAYQAKAAAEFVKKVGELAYNGGGSQARRYRERINKRIRNIDKSSTSCVLKNVDLCISKS